MSKISRRNLSKIWRVSYMTLLFSTNMSKCNDDYADIALKLMIMFGKYCRREKNFTITCHTRICSLHFVGDKNSGPQLFPWNAKKLLQITSAEKWHRKTRTKKETAVAECFESCTDDLNPLSCLASLCLLDMLMSLEPIFH
jgi:hypothetical protein